MALYQPNIQINSGFPTGVYMLNVTLYHVWPEGGVSEEFVFPHLGPGLSNVVLGNSGSGGFDWWTLTFSLTTDTTPKVYSMAPTVVEIQGSGTSSQALVFNVAANGQVNITNPYGKDAPPTPTWAFLGGTGETFLSTAPSTSSNAAAA
jgi:hypothetical protein